ncbi:uncharacterized protein LOC132551616 [Ylistrum balloti]|uniref:uncharacterized protein LOC132551616 n=1 Tax=Ylistrum balloti TaxID=509963 RepID=UPI00290584B9|nr:uncharacterized protein LOC132551616 [Ylistrum balloti]
MKKSEVQSSGRGRRPVERQKMRPWLIQLLDNNTADGLSWVDRKQGSFRINWKHGARNGWNINKDANVFELYAIHTGRHTKNQSPNPKRWKANFRCALNSLDDVTEVKSEGSTRGTNAYRVFKFLEEKKKQIKRRRHQSTESDEDSGVESPSTSKKTRPYRLRPRQRKKRFVKKEAESSSDSSDGHVDSPDVQPDVKEVSLPVPSNDSDEAIDARIKTEYTDEKLGITSGTFPNLGCGFVMIRYGEKREPLEINDERQVKIDDEDDSNDESDSDQEDEDISPSSNCYHSHCTSGLQIASTSRQISVPDYTNMLATRECHASDVNFMSQTIDQQGNLVIAAQVEIPGDPSDHNTLSTQLPIPVIDLIQEQFRNVSQS